MQIKVKFKDEGDWPKEVAEGAEMEQEIENAIIDICISREIDVEVTIEHDR